MTDSLFDASPVAQCLLDRTKCFAAVNAAMCAILGAPVEQLLGRPAETVAKGVDHMIEHAFALAENGRAIPQQTLHRGEYCYGLSCNAVRDARGKIVGLAVAAIDVSRHRAIEHKLRESRRKLLAHSQHDHLTGLLNRRGFEAMFQRALRQTHREQASLALLLVDIDAFKSFNDTFGHGAGDHCLTRVAAELRACLRRPEDAACRYGGEEFAVILPGVDTHGAAVIAENCRKAVEALKIDLPERSYGPASPYGNVTISIGVSTIFPARDRAPTAATIAALLDAADAALYRAKAAGRNRCEIA